MKKPVLFIITTLLLSLPLLAQEAEAPAYRVGEEGKILQRLSWERVNAYFYEIELQRLDNTEWVPELSERTDGLSIEVSLVPGMYRYRIHSYNVLGRIASSSEWTGIRVFVAKPPSASSFSPSSFHYDSNEESFSLTLFGSGLVEDAKIYLIAKAEDAKPIEPLSLRYSPDETEIEAVFSPEALVPGPYDIVITNPGGLSQSVEGFVVDFKQKRDFLVSLGYAPLLPLGGYLFEKNSFSEPAYPIGFYGRVGYIPLKRTWGFLGLEAAPSWAFLKTNGGPYPVSGHLFAFNLDGLYQYWFNHWTMALNLRAGFGLSAFGNMSYDNGGSGKKKGTALFTVNAGVSLLWLVREALFFEGGVTYARSFSSISPAPSYLYFSLGAGWRF
ncbi:MAG: hypothetical protein LBK40_09350 [Spirochaetaceae bacterium]|nr:hypothetical protein [Spirochaetaceae bacterium]